MGPGRGDDLDVMLLVIDRFRNCSASETDEKLESREGECEKEDTLNDGEGAQVEQYQYPLRWSPL